MDFSLITASQILRGRPSWSSPLFRYEFFSYIVIPAISSFIVFISTLSFSSHSSRVVA